MAGFVCVAIGMLICAKSIWASFNQLFRQSSDDKFTTLAAAAAAIGYSESDVREDVVTAKELDRLMGCDKPKA